MSTLVKSDDAFLGRIFGSEWANRLVMPLPFGEKTLQTESPSPSLSIPAPVQGQAQAQLLPKQKDEDEEEEEEKGDDDDEEQEEEEDEQSEEELPKEVEQQHHHHAQLFQDPSHFQALAQERKELNLQKIAKRPREEASIEPREIKMEMETEPMVLEENAHTDKDDDYDDEFHEATITTVEEKIAGASATTATTTLTETTVRASSTILQRRQRLQARSQHLLEVITVPIPKDIVGTPKTKDEEDIRTGVVRLFTRHATAILYQQGVVVLRKDGYIFPRKLLTVLRQAATVLQNSIIDRLDETGKIWSALQVPKSSPSPLDSTKSDDKDYSFTYKEVASRCLGRLDIRYGMDQPPFNSTQVIQNPWLMPLIYSVLGESAKLVYAGLILSFPGSAKQPWHQDGHPLFPELLDAEEPLADLPPYALNVFIPLTPIESALGPTEFWVASHKESSLKRVQQVLASQPNNDNDDDDDDEIFPSLTNDDAPTGVVAPTLNKGDILIYDYRICHRGTENVSTTAVRPMLYLMYARPWFAEHVNFGSTELMESPPPLLPTDWRPQKAVEGGESAKKVKR